jgi:hypothetical protein
MILPFDLGVAKRPYITRLTGIVGQRYFWSMFFSMNFRRAKEWWPSPSQGMTTVPAYRVQPHGGERNPLDW